MNEVNVNLSNLPQTRSGGEIAKLARDELFMGKSPGPIPQSVWMGEGYIAVKLIDTRLHLAQIFVLPGRRRENLGQQYLLELLAVADKYGTEVQCSVEPYGGADIGPDASVLTNWYEKNGFEPVSGRENFLIRAPRVSC